jgi:translation initiation factor 1A
MEEAEIRVRIPRGREVLGIVESLLGTNKLRVRCQDDKIRLCRIPGRIKKRLWLKENTIVLVQPWEIQGDKNGDVIWKYSETEAAVLRRKGILRLQS